MFDETIKIPGKNVNNQLTMKTEKYGSNTICKLVNTLAICLSKNQQQQKNYMIEYCCSRKHTILCFSRTVCYSSLLDTR